MFRHHFADNTNSFNTISYSNYTNCLNSTNTVWNNCTLTDQKPEILAWISSLEPWIWHEDIRTRRVDEVGDWLLQTKEYLNWIDGRSEGESGGSALFCYGDPGVGKTYTR